MSDLPVRNILYLSYCLTFSPPSTSENLAHRYIVSFFFASEPPSRYKGMKETQATELFKLIRRWVDRSRKVIVKLVLTVMFAVDADSTCP